MNILDFLKHNLLYLDGGLGTMLQSAGLAPGEHPERWNITHKDEVRRIHLAYCDAGSNLICANTFGANTLKFPREELAEIIGAAVENARWACEHTATEGPHFVALDLGPTGKLLKPFGDLDFENAVSIFAETVRLGAKAGADVIFIETMNDSYETKAAVLAAKEGCDLPIFVSNAYGADGKLMTGASPAAMVAMLEGLGVDAIGANCSLGPAQLVPVMEEMLRTASIPVLLKPNAGLPRIENGRTVYDVTPDAFAAEMQSLAKAGVRALGGCCGTTPDYIKATVSATKHLAPVPISKKERTVVSSYTHTVVFDRAPILIGERINPTGKKRFKQALQERDIPYILEQGLAQQERGVQLLDVNVGMPGIDEREMLCTAVQELQAVIDLPLQIDTADPVAMEAALRRYNGKAMINSVNGKRESMDAVFPLVKKYGGMVVALTLDEGGIPTSAAGRIAIAERILARAAEYGIEKKDIIFDTLAMTVSADPTAARVTLDALAHIREVLGCHTSLGVSNVSFGLPARDTVNSTFFAMALARGLSAAIMNPFSEEMLRVYFAYRTLAGLDENCADFLQFASTMSAVAPSTAPPQATPQNAAEGLRGAIVKGLTREAAARCRALLAETAPMDIVKHEIVPALDTVGQGFEQKNVYLPQLLMSAEAAQSAFAVIKAHMGSSTAADKGRIVLATVKGDIHDIGKNIVKLLLENYGFAVADLGRDVAPEDIVRAARDQNAPVVGLSALMTTTVPAMEETIRLLRKELPACRVMVGGAVLSADYAARIGADAYAKDAMEAVRVAAELMK